MKVTVELTDAEVAFLERMIRSERRFEHITTIDEALHECIAMTMFDMNETLAAEEGM